MSLLEHVRNLVRQETDEPKREERPVEPETPPLPDGSDSECRGLRNQVF